MLPASTLLPHLASITGLSQNTVNAVHRKLTEDEITPRSRGKAQALFNSKDLTMLLIGSCIALNEPIRNVSKLTPIYYGLRDTNGRRAGDLIANYIDSFRTAKADYDAKSTTPALALAAQAINCTVEIDVGFPSLSITRQTAEGPKTRTYGPITDAPSTLTRVVKSCTISGAVLHCLSLALHGNAR